MKILVVDDHPTVRLGIVQLLTHEFPGVAVGEASTHMEALEAISAQTWDLAILDLSLAGRGGLELLRQAKQAKPEMPVLIHSMHAEKQFSTRALRAGAAGYVTKDSPPETFLQAVRQVISGGKFITQSAAELLVSELRSDPDRQAHELLSDREHDVMLRIAGGQSVGSIATTLNLSVKTVSTYRTRVLTKMSLENNSELVQYAIRNGLVE